MNSNSSGNRCLTINELKKMRKIYSFMVAAAALFTAASCNKELPQEQLPVGETVVYTASVDGADTKAQLNEAGTKSEWVANDAITVHDGTNSYKFTTAQAGQNVEFTNSENFGEYRPVIAVYPYGDKYTVEVDAKTVKANIPTYQPAREGTYNENAALAVAYSEGSDFAFKNAHALLKFTVKGEKSIKAIEFYGNNSEAITGDMLVTLNEDNTIASVEGQDTEFKENDQTNVMKGTWVKLYSEDEANSWCFKENVTYYAAIAPANFTEGFAINLILADDTKIEGYKKFEGELNLEASKILPLGEIEYVAPGAESSGWSLPGVYNGWSTATTFLYEEGDYFVARNVSGLNTGFKFQHAEFGWKGVGSTDPVAAGQWHKLNGEANISLTDANAYDIYMTKDGSQFQAVAAGSAAPEAPVVVADYWGLIGVGGDWANDKILVEEGDYLVVKNVSITATDQFKFRKNSEWNEQKIAKGGLAAANTEYDLVDAGSSNMKVSTAGTYDIYLKKDLSKVYCMEAGKTPDQAVQPDLSKTYRFYVQNKVGWSTLNFYAWGGYVSAGWPGDKMTVSATVEGYGACKYIEITKGVSVVNFIVNNGSKQTKDLKVSGNSNVKTLANGDMIYILTSADLK